MTLKQLQKKLTERRIVLTMNFLVRKKIFYVQASQWNKPVAKIEHEDLETAIRMVLDQVTAFKPMTSEEKAAKRANAQLLRKEDEWFGNIGEKS